MPPLDEMQKTPSLQDFDFSKFEQVASGINAYLDNHPLIRPIIVFLVAAALLLKFWKERKKE